MLPLPAAPAWKWAVLLLLLGCCAAGGAVFVEQGVGATALFTTALVIAVAGAVIGRRLMASADRSPWLAASLALALFLLGTILVWIEPTLSLGPFASAADVLFLAAVLSLAVAAATAVPPIGVGGDRSVWLDASIVTAVVGVVVWEFLVVRQLDSSSLGSSSNLVRIVPPLAAVVTLGFVVALVFSGAARTQRVLALSVGATLLLIGYLVRLNDGEPAFRPGGHGAAIWLAGYLLIGFAAFAPGAGRTCRLGPPHVWGQARLAVVLTAVFVPELLVVRNVARHDLLALNSVTFAACVSLGVLTLAALRLRHLFAAAKQAEAHRGEARLSAVILHSADAILLVDATHQITFASPSAEELSGKPSDALMGASVVEWFSDGDRAVVEQQLANVAAMPTGETVPLEGTVHSESGGVLVVEGTARNLLDNEHVKAIVVNLRDTTDRRELEQQLERRAFHDELTGLANRALFADRMSHALKLKLRHSDVALAVLFVDLDDFKAVNDGMGHDAGDELIRGVAERIRAKVRPGDTVARLGGDEFAVLVEDTLAPDDVVSLAQRIIEVLQEPIVVRGVGMAVPASVGVTFATHDSTVDSLLRDADIAMYSAKSQGKGRVEIFNSALRDVAVRRLAVRVELPEALRTNQFRVVYQPIKEVADERLTGFEALLRWHHPRQGIISPGEFIPAAEETGLIVDLGRWVLNEACKQTATWNRNAAEPLSISVNVSGLQLHQAGFCDDVRETLANTGLEAESLTLELTESVLVKHQRVETVLRELREIGVGIAIDDFGTGYSSLSYLQEFPATSLKINHQFTSTLADYGDSGLVRSILAIGETLGLTTVAEGVETVEHLEMLRELGCDRAQGFLLGRPQAPGQIDGLLEVIRMSRTDAWRRSPVGALRSW